MKYLEQDELGAIVPANQPAPPAPRFDPELLRSLAPMSPKKSDLPVLRELRNTLNTTLMANGQTDIAMAWVHSRGTNSCLMIEQEIEVEGFLKNKKNRVSLGVRIV